MDARESWVTIAWRYAVVLVVTILVLGLLNGLPQFLGGEPLGVVRYARVEDAEARLGARLYRPTVLPAGWRWPPSSVRLAVGRPDWIEFVFDENAEGGEAEGSSLVLCQALGFAPADSQVASVLLPPGELLQADDISIDGRVARMQRLLLDGGAIVHELWWQEGAKRVMLRGRVPANDLARLARALLGNR